MTDRIKRMKVGKRDAGFTLIELLVVITILGILAAIVVFSVGGISDKGAASACKTDTTTMQTAEEANFARGTTVNGIPGGVYVPETSLVTAGLLNSASNLHDVTEGDGTTPMPATGFTTYKIIPNSPAPASHACGTDDSSS